MKREFTLDIDGQEITVAAERDGDAITVTRDDATYTVRILSESVVGVQAGTRHPTGGGVRTAAPAPQAPRAAGPAAAPAPATGQGGGPPAGAGAVTSPMTGVIDQVLVADGASVSEGDTIIILEAMKMYIDVMASTAGTVTGISVKPGDSVQEGQPLLSITPLGGAE
ncbi:MAG: acetyl-CoA carboxylase biotin carboxyl carrier protein subunit [Alkalispirochaeta sp.]